MRVDRFLCGISTVAMTLTVVGGCVFTPPDTRGAAHSTGGAGTNGAGGLAASGGRSESGGAGGELASGGASVGGSGGAGDAAAGATVTGGSAQGGGGGRTSGGTAGSATGGSGGSTAVNCALGSSFAWSSTSSLMDPMADGSHQDPIALRDPTVVYYGGKFTLYATLVKNDGTSTMEAASFVDWPASSSATVYFMDNSSSFSGSHAAPQLFYMAGQKKWYLLSQANGPAYSTAADPAPSASWTKPSPFFSSTPTIVSQNAGSGPGWTDFWVICDSASCHMFFGNNNGYVFRSQTSLASFPNGFGTPVVVTKSSSANDLFGGVSVYKVKGSQKYLLLVEAVGSWHYIRSWTADTLDGTWTALADSESNPFAGLSNLSFSTATPWTKDVAEGELVRDGYDETMPVNPCNLRYVYQGRNAYTSDPPAKYPWRLALAAKTN